MKITLATVLFAAASSVLAQAPLYEPADGKVVFGAWVDVQDPAKADPLIGVGGDSPATFNKRLGQNAGVFHFSQRLPLDKSKESGEEQTCRSSLLRTREQVRYLLLVSYAILFITVYPHQWEDNPYDLYTDADILKLAYQLDNLTHPNKSARRVMLRFAPEMNGNWFNYGQQPTRFVQEYKRIVDKIRSVTSRVSFVWAPNAADSYPFGAPLGAYELSALDTNKNGILDYNDDPFSPYWPGEDYVDWVGISLYWKGDPSTQYPLHDNSVCPGNYWEQMVQGGPLGSNEAFPFYDMFAKKYNKPLVMPEGGASFSLTQQPSPDPLPVGAGRVNILQGFWRSYLNPTFFRKFPKAKMFINFETGKTNGVTRDYRITWDPATVAAFQADMKALNSTMQWAVPFVYGFDPLKIGGGQTPAQAAGSSNGGSSTPAKTGDAGRFSVALVLMPS
ncbi:glycoside hydrolase [Rhizoclosmatium globosum]|uniref:Glycoside hydrolase n=1 Tax=Rhizoclosmatium globosum TaxID=329046 RepID=A0A1Y2CNH2_9FUNG|nr:glycoside hydrolase [Rhizoclosmatium globosum]|eukprot:ORY48553.1 glycoside hydrolase [Rhizoclosmatium globosum]